MTQRSEELIRRAEVLPGLLRRAANHPIASKAEGARISDLDETPASVEKVLLKLHQEDLT